MSLQRSGVLLHHQALVLCLAAVVLALTVHRVTALSTPTCLVDLRSRADLAAGTLSGLRLRVNPVSGQAELSLNPGMLMGMWTYVVDAGRSVDWERVDLDALYHPPSSFVQLQLSVSGSPSAVACTDLAVDLPVQRSRFLMIKIVMTRATSSCLSPVLRGVSITHSGDGFACDACPSMFYGETCDPCPGCVNGFCDDRINGTGVCVCDGDHFVGSLCNACAPGYYGPQCLPCPACVNGQCDQGIDGSGVCICDGPVFAGDLCDSCIPGHAGPACDPIPIPCQFSVAASTRSYKTPRFQLGALASYTSPASWYAGADAAARRLPGYIQVLGLVDQATQQLYLVVRQTGGPSPASGVASILGHGLSGTADLVVADDRLSDSLNYHAFNGSGVFDWSWNPTSPSAPADTADGLVLGPVVPGAHCIALDILPVAGSLPEVFFADADFFIDADNLVSPGAFDYPLRAPMDAFAALHTVLCVECECPPHRPTQHPLEADSCAVFLLADDAGAAEPSERVSLLLTPDVGAPIRAYSFLDVSMSFCRSSLTPSDGITVKLAGKVLPTAITPGNMTCMLEGLEFRNGAVDARDDTVSFPVSGIIPGTLVCPDLPDVPVVPVGDPFRAMLLSLRLSVDQPWPRITFFLQGAHPSWVTALVRSCASDVADCITPCTNGDCVDGQCVCEEGWTGIDCGTPICFSQLGCALHGTCVGPDLCECDPGYGGARCELLRCHPVSSPCPSGLMCKAGLCLSPECPDLTCLNGGTCIDFNQCLCPPGFIDDDCGTPACGDDGYCRNGVCFADRSVCVCDQGWAGPACNRCAPGYHGPDCIPGCVNDCSDRGTCTSSGCLCMAGWSGIDCSTPSQTCSPFFMNTTLVEAWPEDTSWRQRWAPSQAAEIITSEDSTRHLLTHRQGDGALTLSLRGLPSHTNVTISIKLAVIGTWDGEVGQDLWRIDDLSAGGGHVRTVFATSFANADDSSTLQCYPGISPCPGSAYPPRAGASEANAILPPDAVYDISLTWPHAASNLDLLFIGWHNLPQESWALEEVMVAVYSVCQPPDDSVCRPRPGVEVCHASGICDITRDLCYCDTDHSGRYCACPACGDHGTCDDATGVCQCDASYAGERCDQLVCDPPCSDTGVCISGRCICDAGYTGETCDIVDPPGSCFPPCSPTETCDEATDTCVCLPGYLGRDCLLCDPSVTTCAECANACAVGAICDTQTGLCNCPRNRYGATCSLAPCAELSDCHGQGSCQADATCLCDAGFAGQDCGIVCPDGCGAHSIGCADGHCLCERGWSGDACDQCDPRIAADQCAEVGCSPSDCSGNGVCDSSSQQCVCDDGLWIGQACNVPRCPGGCSSHGQCDVATGVCDCDLPWTGAACNLFGLECLPDASDACSGNGQCASASRRCACDTGFTGLACDLCDPVALEQCRGLCPNDCSGNGLCSVLDSTCTCGRNFFGDDCANTLCAPHACSGHGSCVIDQSLNDAAVCDCDDGWTGADCSRVEASPGLCPGLPVCSGRGQCDQDGRCDCLLSWRGASCSVIGLSDEQRPGWLLALFSEFRMPDPAWNITHLGSESQPVPRTFLGWFAHAAYPAVNVQHRAGSALVLRFQLLLRGRWVSLASQLSITAFSSADKRMLNQTVTSFAHQGRQCYPDAMDNCPIGGHPARTGAVEEDSVVQYGPSSAYDIEFRVPARSDAETETFIVISAPGGPGVSAEDQFAIAHSRVWEITSSVLPGDPTAAPGGPAALLRDTVGVAVILASSLAIASIAAYTMARRRRLQLPTQASLAVPGDSVAAGAMPSSPSLENPEAACLDQ